MTEHKRGLVEGIELGTQLVKKILERSITPDEVLAQYNKLVLYGADLYLEMADEKDGQLTLFGNTLIEEMVQC